LETPKVKILLKTSQKLPEALIVLNISRFNLNYQMPLESFTTEYCAKSLWK